MSNEWTTPVACIEARGLSLRIGSKTLVAPLNMTWQAGQVCAILGPNGAGKSSLLSMLSLEQRASSGSLEIHGRPSKSYSLAELARFRAVMPQAAQVAFDFKVQEVVELGRYPHRLAPSPDEALIPMRAMALTQVQHLAARSFNTLSGGEKSRVHLARALAQIWEPLPSGEVRWLLLDEPTAALDLAHQQAVLQTVRRWAGEQGVGVIAVLHDLNLALRYTDQAVVLCEGRCVASGETANILTPHCVQDVWGVSCSLEHRTDGTSYLLL
jgi:iron complex transport system ATP-binding protein